MSLVDFVYENVESIFAWLGTVLKQDALTYCDLESADSRQVLVGKDGSLATIVRLDGYKRFVGPNEFAYLCERITEAFQPSMSASGHYIQFYFAHEKETVRQSLQEALLPAKRTAKRLHLKVEDIFESRVDKLASFCANEDCFIVLWTAPFAIEKNHLKRLQKDRQNKFKNSNLPRLTGAQNIFATLSELRNIHESFISSIVEDLMHAGFYLQTLDVHKACYEVRRSIDPDFTDTNWRPFLPGDKLPVRYKGKIHKKDYSNLMWPPLDGQLIPREGESVGFKFAKIGDRIYAPLFIELFPKEIKPFYELFRRLLPSHIPWRISYFIGGDGIKISSAKNMLAQVLAFSSTDNRLIADTHKMLKNLHERSDDPIIKLFVIASTWAPANNEDLLKERVAKLAKAMQSWGNAETSYKSGDPFGTTVSSSLGLTTKIMATASAAPLSDAVHMMPFVRPASPWSAGALLFRTPDGKIWPYQPGSSLQVSWIDIIYARSGSGKSVLLSTINLGLCLLAGLSHLPRISIIDIGPSSKGFISLLKEGLPEDKAHQVLYHRLTLDESDAINAFDTNIGARYPTRAHRSFLTNFISLLLLENVEDPLPEGMTSMISMIIDETYKRFGDTEQPKIYVRHSDEEIEAALTDVKLPEDAGQVTWWHVADALYDAGKIKLALKAQRYAMPTIADTVSIAHTPSIKDLYAGVKTTSNEGYVEAFSRIISGVIRTYPTLTSITRLNFEGARIIALDLDEVAKTGSASADKQTAIMYMLARHVLARDFFLNADEVAKIPKRYQQRQLDQVKQLMEEPKRIVFDEFHRTSKCQIVRNQILTDMREGRKWKIHIALSSQSLKDFDELMVEFATSVFILDSGSSLSVEQTCKTFGLTETERMALTNRVHGPTSEGATFIAQFVTKRGMNTQLLTSTIGPVELWAFNTTAEDVRIRDALYQVIGPVSARRLLAQKFPRGSATHEIETALKNDPTITVSAVCDKIIDDLTELHKRSQQKVTWDNLDEGLL